MTAFASVMGTQDSGSTGTAATHTHPCPMQLIVGAKGIVDKQELR